MSTQVQVRSTGTHALSVEHLHASYEKHAVLIDVNLTGSRIEGLKIDAAQLPALTIDPAQAMVIVQMLGAKIA